jgi:acid phosphatase class B
MKNIFKKLGVVVVSSAVAVGANADVATAISAAQTDGISNATLAAVAVISVAAIALGVGLVISLLKR